MRYFLNFIFFLFLGLYTPAWAADTDDVTAHHQNDPEFHGKEIRHYTQSRVEWYEEVLQTLQNAELKLEDKCHFIHKRMGKEQFKPLSIKNGLSSEAKKKLILKSIIENCNFSIQYWRFLNRNFEFYSQNSNNSPDVQKQVVPHLVLEILNGAIYARGDIQESQNRYTLEEYFILQIIHEECSYLATHYEIEIEPFPSILDMETKEEVSFKELKSAPEEGGGIKGNIVLHYESKPEPAPRKSPYFMDKLIYYRGQLVANELRSLFNYKGKPPALLG